MTQAIPKWATHYRTECVMQGVERLEMNIIVIGNLSAIGWTPISKLAKELAIEEVCQQIKDKPLSERMEPVRNKYHREIKPDVWADVYDVLAAFTGSISERCKPAIDHAIKKLLAPGLRGIKAERQDLVEARDSIDRAIQQLDEWA